MFAVRCLPYLSDQNEKGSQQNNESEKAFVRQRNMFGAGIKILWEEQLVAPPIYCKGL